MWIINHKLLCTGACFPSLRCRSEVLIPKPCTQSCLNLFKLTAKDGQLLSLYFLSLLYITISNYNFLKFNSIRCRYVEGRWIPSGKAERPPSNAIYVHNESPNFGAHWMKEPVNFSKLKLSNKKSEPGMVSFFIATKVHHQTHTHTIWLFKVPKSLFRLLLSIQCTVQ
jgi:hypothetical protein